MWRRELKKQSIGPLHPRIRCGQKETRLLAMTQSQGQVDNKGGRQAGGYVTGEGQPEGFSVCPSHVMGPACVNTDLKSGKLQSFFLSILQSSQLHFAVWHSSLEAWLYVAWVLVAQDTLLDGGTHPGSRYPCSPWICRLVERQPYIDIDKYLP